MKWIVVTLILILLATTTLAGSYKTYTIEHKPIKTKNNMLTFEISHGKSKTIGLRCTQKLTKSRREFNNKLIADKEHYQKCLKKVTKNWKRTITSDSYEKEYDKDKKKWVTLRSWNKELETVRGSDSRLDRRFKDRLWRKIRAGEPCPKRISY